MKTIALLFLISPCWAKDYPINKPVAAIQLHQELEASGFKVSGITCRNAKCVVSLVDVERKNPSAIIAAHVPLGKNAMRQSMLDELAALEIKLDDGTATIADLRRIAKIDLKLSGLARRP